MVFIDKLQHIQSEVTSAIQNISYSHDRVIRFLDDFSLLDNYVRLKVFVNQQRTMLPL